MMSANAVMEAWDRTSMPAISAGYARYDIARSARFKRPSAIEHTSTGVMTLFTGDSSTPHRQSLVPSGYVVVPTIAVGMLYWEGPETFNEIASTTPRDRLIGRLRGYKLLSPNWNGYGGQRPSSNAVEDCINFLRSLDSSCVLPKPMVGGDGEVGIFWETDAFYIEVSFRGNDCLEYLVSVDGKDIEGIGPLDPLVPELAESLAHISCL